MVAKYLYRRMGDNNSVSLLKSRIFLLP